MFKVLGFDADEQRWLCVSKHHGFQQARAGYFVAKQLRSHQCVALVQVRVNTSDGADAIEILESDAPRADHLPEVAGFRAAALAK